MIFIFFAIIVAISARTLDPSQLKKIKFKLDKYQAATGIDDVKRDEILNKTIENSEILARISISKLNILLSSPSRSEKLQ